MIGKIDVIIVLNEVEVEGLKIYPDHSDHWQGRAKLIAISRTLSTIVNLWCMFIYKTDGKAM